MTQYKSKSITVNRAAQDIVEKFADLSAFGSALDSMPAEDRAKVGDVTFDKDSITIDTKQVGKIVFKIVNRTPERVAMTAVGSPVPLELSVNLKPVGETATEIVTAIDVEIPAMLRPMVGGAMQKAVDQFGELMVKLNG